MKRHPTQHALTIVIIYAVLSATWILWSKKVIELIFSSPSQLPHAIALNGLLFVLITSLFLYWLITRKLPESIQGNRWDR